MDIVRRLKQEFSGTALEDVADQVRVYVKERHEAADEIERLRKENAELLEGLKRLNRVAQDSYGSPAYGGMASSFVQSIVKQTIAKATGGE